MDSPLYGPWGRILIGLAAGVLALLVGLGAVIATEEVTLRPRATADPYAQVPVVLPTQAPSPTPADLVFALQVPPGTSEPAAGASEPPVNAPTATPTALPPSPTPEPTATPLPPSPTPIPTATPSPTETPVSALPQPTPTASQEEAEIVTPAQEAPGALPGRVASAAGSNLREGPGLDRPVIVVLPGETRILALGRTEDGGWVQVLAPDLAQSGWLRIDQVVLEGDVMALPVATE